MHPSQHAQTVPVRVPYATPHGARMGFPAGTQRLLSAGDRRVPGGMRPGIPYGTRLHPVLFDVQYPYGSRQMFTSS